MALLQQFGIQMRNHQAPLLVLTMAQGVKMTQTAQLDTFTVQAQAHVKCSVAQKATRSMEQPTRVLHQSPAELVTPTTQRLSRAKRTKVKQVESFNLIQNLIV